jgi:hypothetical protein
VKEVAFAGEMGGGAFLEAARDGVVEAEEDMENNDKSAFKQGNQSKPSEEKRSQVWSFFQM